MEYLVPTINNGTIEDGAYIHALNFCKKNCKSKKCEEFYNKISESNFNQFITCPHGLSVFVYKDDDDVRFCVGMRERSSYDRSLSKNLQKDDEKVYNPALDKEQLHALILYSSRINSDEIELRGKQASIESISHEAKKLNAQIKDYSDQLLQDYPPDTHPTLSPEEMQSLLSKIRTIYICSSMVNSRFSLLNYEKNPEALSDGALSPCVVYKKFDKIRRVFANSIWSKCPVIINGNSYRYINAYPTFEMIPLLIVENAVKYSYSSNPVTISFSEPYGDILVEVSSYSPYCSQYELEHIFEKGFRGKNAKKAADGSGIGLFFVKMLCDLHNIDISVNSDSKRIDTINNIAYSTFTIRLLFRDTFS